MSKLAIKLISENKKTKDPFLDLGNCGLTKIPDLSGLYWLQTLIVSNKWWDRKEKRWQSSQNRGKANNILAVRVGDIPNSIKTMILAGDYNLKRKIKDWTFITHLINLEVLELSFNEIDKVTFLDNLINLKSLDLRVNPISDFRFLEKLTSLQTLYLSSNQISDMNSGGFPLLEKLTGLQTLDLSTNQISDISFLEKLTGLQSLDLSSNQISDYSFLEKLTGLQTLDLRSNRISDIHFLEKLTGLQTLDLRSNQVNKIHFLEKLTGLQSLDLSSNQISDYSFLEKLTGLQTLNLSSNHISDMSSGGVPLLEKLTDLQTLNLSSNQISDIEALLPLLKNGLEISLEKFDFEGKINLFGNPISNPPLEIVKQGREAVIEYFEKLIVEGTDYIYEAKLTLVGDGGAGKTSLQTRIIDKDAPLPKSEERTRGIKISYWHFKDKESKKYTANIWDFGGQDVYYPVHRFFLTENSVYVLMASTRIQSHNFEYWIPTIYQFGGNSPIILVQTCHDNNRSHWNDLGIFYGNPNFKILKPHFELNLPNRNEGLITLENAIEQQIIQLPHIGKPVPSSWVRVRAALAERQKFDACISYEKFVEVCQTVDAKNFQKTSDVELLGRFFADLGIILWYHDKEYLKDWVILQPQWAMLAVYKIIDDVEVQKCGIIRKNDFKRLWCEEEFIQKHELLKNMIQVFKIAFPKKHSKEDFILPARLNSLPDEKRWTNIDKTIRLEYTFDFMPRGIVNQLSAELSRQIKSDSDVWNNAVNFGLNGSEAQVEEDYFKRNIYIKANGQDARGLVVLIIESIENTLSDYRGVKYFANVPCNCQICSKSEAPSLFPYPKLIEWAKTKQTVVCNESSTAMTINSLIFNAGLESLIPTSRMDNFEFEENMRKAVSNNQNSNIVSPVFNINTTSPATIPSEAPKVESELEKELKKMKKKEEDHAVRKWKNTALITFVFSLLITLTGLSVYYNELGNFDWKKLKGGNLFNLIGIGLMAFLNGFPIKMMYDRFLDSTKEKGFRENLKNK